MKIKDNDMFLRTLQLEEDYIFNRIKNCLTSLAAIPEDSQPEFKATLETIYKTEISTLFSLARWRLSVVESEFWKKSILAEAGKVLFKDGGKHEPS
jgi:hypothetical protein